MRYLLSLLFFIVFGANAQNRYLVYLKDKAQNNYSVSEPQAFLSQRALDRRAKHKVEISLQDLPVSQPYLDQIKATGFKTIYTSKWLNAVLVEGNATQLNNLKNLNFVLSIETNGDIRGATKARKQHKLESTAFSYGNSLDQLKMLGADTMHQEGYTGQGVLVAVMDAGFPNVDKADAFKHLHTEKKIVKTYNYVSNSNDVYQLNNHGTNVLSLMAAKLPGKLYGTAPDASYALYITEDYYNESRQEEFFWAVAAENADSLGVDVINTSLGYYDFDDPKQNYTYAQMDGKSTVMVKAANYATQVGIVVVNAAGNSGTSDWKYISTPADGFDVITVGSVNQNRIKAATSSFGPTADGRIKPEVMAMGHYPQVSNSGSNTTSGSGTSYASPLIAGFVAGLVQKYPTFTNQQIRNLLISSADRFSKPDNSYGYGIPSYSKFVQLAKPYEPLLGLETNQLKCKVYPNPWVNSEPLKIYINAEEIRSNFKTQLYDIGGKLVAQSLDDLKDLEGIYVLRIEKDKQTCNTKLYIKK